MAPAEELTAVELEALVGQLSALPREGPGISSLELTEETIVRLIESSQCHVAADQTLAEVEPPVTIYGDLHGQFWDLLGWFERLGPPSAGQRCLFLGDYVDRGRLSIEETICILLAYKCLHPDKVLLLRGNHEWESVNRNYGFMAECRRRYSSRLWRRFNQLFDFLPLVALVGRRIFCVHGGLSPQLASLESVRTLKRPPAPLELVADLVWSDPNVDAIGFIPNRRGISFEFGAEAVAAACRRLDVDLICRAHQVVQDGYEFFADRRLVTVFSAPRYCGEFDNAGAVMQIDVDLVCSFHTCRRT